jgi:methionine--tRNA ligase beta chain
VEISFKEFQNLDLRIGKVLEAEKIEGSRNLVRLMVDFGTEKRQAVAGVAQHYNPEDLVNNEYMFILNLEKRKMMGMESQCMIFAAEDKDGKIVLMRPEKEVEPGSHVR